VVAVTTYLLENRLQHAVMRWLEKPKTKAKPVEEFSMEVGVNPIMPLQVNNS
jgi:hypothetical protein